MASASFLDGGTDDRNMSRREVCVMGLWGAMATMGFISSNRLFAAAQTLTLTPDAPEGPHWLDGMADRSDIRSSTSRSRAQPGVLLKLSLMVVKLAGKTVKPISDAKVDLWQCNAAGHYSGLKNTSDQDVAEKDFLRGCQVTTSHGITNFLTIVPGWHAGRTPHLHVRVRQYSSSMMTHNFTTQLFFADDFTNDIFTNSPYSTRPQRDTTNESDTIYSGPSSDNDRTSLPPRGAQLLMFEGAVTCDRSIHNRVVI